MAEQETYKTGQEDILYRIEVENPFKVLGSHMHKGFYDQNKNTSRENFGILSTSGKSLEEDI